MSATKQINVRLPLELHKALDDHKVRTGEDKATVIKRGIELALLTTDGSRLIAVPPKPDKPNEPKAPTVELAAWLAGRCGLPRALAARRIKEGKVTVDGEVYTDERLSRESLDKVALDGRKV